MATNHERQRQHLVSKGHQQNFARDHRVTVLDARTGVTLDPDRPIKTNWRLDDFLTVVNAAGNRDNSLETEYARTERRAINQVREIALSRMSIEQRRALDELAAIHLVRSLSFVAIHGQITDAFFDSCVADILADSGQQLLESFISDRGRRPAPGELQTLVAAQTRRFQTSPDLTVNGMRHAGTGIQEVLSRHRVQLVEAPSWMPGFVLADQPVLHALRNEGRYGFIGHLAIGDADLIMIPIQRRLLALYTTQQMANFTLKTKRGLRVINAALCRNAVKEVACHPDDAQDTSQVIRYIDQYPASALSDGTLK